MIVNMLANFIVFSEKFTNLLIGGDAGKCRTGKSGKVIRMPLKGNGYTFIGEDNSVKVALHLFLTSCLLSCTYSPF